MASRKCCGGENTEEIWVAKQVVWGGLALKASFANKYICIVQLLANLQLLANRRAAKYGRTKQGLSVALYFPRNLPHQQV